MKVKGKVDKTEGNEMKNIWGGGGGFLPWREVVGYLGYPARAESSAA